MGGYTLQDNYLGLSKQRMRAEGRGRKILFRPLSSALCPCGLKTKIIILKAIVVRGGFVGDAVITPSLLGPGARLGSAARSP